MSNFWQGTVPSEVWKEMARWTRHHNLFRWMYGGVEGGSLKYKIENAQDQKSRSPKGRQDGFMDREVFDWILKEK